MGVSAPNVPVLQNHRGAPHLRRGVAFVGTPTTAAAVAGRPAQLQLLVNDRRRKPTELVRNAVARVRVTATESAELVRRAARVGLAVSEYVRQRCLEGSEAWC